MASATDVDREIERLQQSLQALDAEVSASSHHRRHRERGLSSHDSPPQRHEHCHDRERGQSSHDSPPQHGERRHQHKHSTTSRGSPPRLNLYDSPVVGDSVVTSQAVRSVPASRPTKRKELEPRRYAGREPVHEYITQFELVAKRNGWEDGEKATSLLCALDGSARSILSELDDPSHTTYDAIKELLLKRFGPVRHTEVHEQALQEVRLTRGQPIRELTPEVLRLSKLAYPDFGADARNRMAIKALINAISDKGAVFYIKDKAPTTLDDVCSFYERYRVLTGDAQPKAAVKSVKSTVDSVPDHRDEALTSLRQHLDRTDQQLQQLISTVGQQNANASQQFQQLTTAISQLLTSRPAEPVPAPPSQPPLSATAPVFQPGQVPRKPCPRCNQPGHWAKHCPLLAHNQQPSRFNGSGPAPPLNQQGPVSAPDARSSHHSAQ